jgi:HSP20 family protein
MATETAVRTDENGRTEDTRSGQFYRPNVDILETADALLVLADMPGVQGNDIDINFEDGSLVIHGKVRDRQAEDQTYLLQEYGLGDFYRTFRVSEQIDASRITAELRDGVLTLQLPKAEAAKPRKISVRAR